MPDGDSIEERGSIHDSLNSYVWQSGKLRGIVVGEESVAELKKIAGIVKS
jgi:hypothetical protein